MSGDVSAVGANADGDAQGDTADIDLVLRRVRNIVDESRARANRVGYFAAMYLGVTRAVKDRIVAGGFDDGRRMSRFDRAFADHYFSALDAHRQGAPQRASWRLAFEAAKRRQPIALQHLLLGMNAHIGFDLGLTVDALSPDGNLEPLHRDFNRINGILAALVDRVQGALSSVSPWLGAVDFLGGRLDEGVSAFSIEVARDGAWRFATRLAAARPAERPGLIEARDASVARFGETLVRPGLAGFCLVQLVRLRETRDPRAIIDALDRAT